MELGGYVITNIEFFYLVIKSITLIVSNDTIKVSFVQNYQWNSKVRVLVFSTSLFQLPSWPVKNNAGLGEQPVKNVIGLFC